MERHSSDATSAMWPELGASNSRQTRPGLQGGEGPIAGTKASFADKLKAASSKAPLPQGPLQPRVLKKPVNLTPEGKSFKHKNCIIALHIFPFRKLAGRAN